jgi:hypothetical protein
MLRQVCVVIVTVGLVSSASTAAGQIFTDGLSNGLNWTVAQDGDTSFVFGYDYSQQGIPAAPRGGGDTIGLKFEVNNNPPNDINQIVAYNSNAAFTGQYTLRADVWINWALVGGTVGQGTTEFAGLGVGHDGLAPGPSGASFLFDGDGDTVADYRLYKNSTVQDPASGQYTTGTAAGANGNTNATYSAAFPAIDVAAAVPDQGQTGTTLAGAGGFQWMTVNLEVDTIAIGPSGIAGLPGFTRVSLRSASSGNLVTVGTIDNSNGGAFVSMEGSIALLMSDIFNSVTTNPALSFAIFDNVQVFAGLVPLDPGVLGGDYNDNGVVDAADYTVWRDNLGGAAGTLTNDVDGGMIGQAQYETWKANFGMTTGMGQGALGHEAVPEPAAWILLIAAFLSIAGAGRSS